MKILMLTRLYLPHIGGVELHIKHLMEAAGKDYRFVIVAEQHDPSLVLHETVGNIEIWRIPIGRSRKLSIWLWILQHRQILFQADVIHIHDVFFWILPFPPFFLGKRKTMTFHGYEGNEIPNWKQILWHRLAALLSDGNLCIGGFHEKWYGVKPTRMSFGAVDVGPRHDSRLRSNSKRFLYVGRLSRDTGILNYLQALTAYDGKWTVDVFGDGPDLIAAKKLAKGLPVTFHGFVSSDAIKWEDYDVALVSRYLAILEALAHGLPVIADSDSDIKYDYLALSPFAQWITITQSVDALKEALRQIHPAPLEARAWARQQTWKKMFENYEILWHTPNPSN